MLGIGKLLVAGSYIQELSFVASSEGVANPTSTDVIVAPPTGAQVGDLLIAILDNSHTSGDAWNTASGWTEHIDQNAQPNLGVQSRDHDGSSSYTFTGVGSRYRIAHLLCFRNAVVDVVGTLATNSGTSLTIPGVTMTAEGILVAGSGIYNTGSSAIGTPAGMTEQQATQVGGTVALKSFREVVSAGATGSRAATNLNSNAAAGVLIGVKLG